VIVYFGRFLKITKEAGLFFRKVHVIILTKNVLGYILGDFLANSSGRPGRSSAVDEASPREFAFGFC
jgi:hypothetical protein